MRSRLPDSLRVSAETGPEKGACEEVSGLADTKLFWVDECQARKLSESAGSTRTSQGGSLHLENVRLCVLGILSICCLCSTELGAGSWDSGRGSGLSLMVL